LGKRGRFAAELQGFGAGMRLADLVSPSATGEFAARRL
jgi:hypothetical protein